MFVGRERERARIDRLLQEARAGRSGALLLHGEAGIGKTALMRWAIGQATGLRVLRARGIETESDIPFAGLAELVTPLLDRLDAVPEVQPRALRGALAPGPAPRPGPGGAAPGGARGAGAGPGHASRPLHRAGGPAQPARRRGRGAAGAGGD